MAVTRTVNLVVVHCAATKPSQNVGVAEIDRWHRARGFLKVGYHYVIRKNGNVELGRPEHEAGAHAEGFNRNSLGVCLEGGIAEDTGQPEDNFTAEQRAALVALLIQCRDRYPGCTIVGHRDLRGVRKACPSFDVRALCIAHNIPIE